MRSPSQTRRYRRAIVLVAGLVLALVACSADSADPTSALLPAEPTTTLAAPTTLAATTTLAVTTTTVLETSGQPMVLVAFGDSAISYPSAITAAIGAYADLLERAFGAPIDVRDHTGWGSSPAQLLNALDSERVLADLAEADVVLLEIPQGDTAGPFMTATGHEGRNPADCGGDDQKQCLRDYVTENRAAVESIFSALTTVCDPSEVLVRAIDMYQMEIETQNETGGLQITSPYFMEAQVALEEIAASYGIPVAHVYAEFMGPARTDDPQDRGLLRGDQRHTTWEGAKRIAELLGDLGYEPAA